LRGRKNMPYYLFKLKFLAPVHFGADISRLGLESSAMYCHCDTLFSAFCHEILRNYGEDALGRLVEDAREGRLLLSDTMPYDGTELYLPKPVLYFDRSQETGQKADRQRETMISLKKRMKKITHIPISSMNEYIRFLKEGGDDLPFTPPCFGSEAVFPKVAVSGLEEPQPYSVGTFLFKKGAGLYFILGIEDKNRLDYFKELIVSLGYSGIGGKRTSGYGRFELEEDEIELDPEYYAAESDRLLADMIAQESSLYISLSVVSPAAEDWRIINDQRSSYSLVQRRGFVLSETYSDRFLKRSPLVMINAGSCFPERLKGTVHNVAKSGRHAVYRYGMGMMIGVTV